MSRTTKILGFSVPPAVVREVESLAKAEKRTKSELFREMVRVYRRYRDQRDRDEDRWITGLIQQARTEQAAQPASVDELLAESDRLVRYGTKQAKRAGVKAKDVNRVIDDYRRSRKT